MFGNRFGFENWISRGSISTQVAYIKNSLYTSGGSCFHHSPGPLDIDLDQFSISTMTFNTYQVVYRINTYHGSPQPALILKTADGYLHRHTLRDSG